jgi:hypothetical protein
MYVYVIMIIIHSKSRERVGPCYKFRSMAVEIFPLFYGLCKARFTGGCKIEGKLSNMLRHMKNLTEKKTAEWVGSNGSVSEKDAKKPQKMEASRPAFQLHSQATPWP